MCEVAVRAACVCVSFTEEKSSHFRTCGAISTAEVPNNKWIFLPEWAKKNCVSDLKSDSWLISLLDWWRLRTPSQTHSSQCGAGDHTLSTCEERTCTITADGEQPGTWCTSEYELDLLYLCCLIPVIECVLNFDLIPRLMLRSSESFTLCSMLGWV